MDIIQMVSVTVPTMTSQGWEATKRPCIRKSLDNIVATESLDPPDLTRGHRPQEPALRPSPVNGGAERKEPSLYARSEPGETVTNKEGSSDRLANQLGVARPDGPTSWTVALTTAHSSHRCGEQAPHHLSPWFRQPIASRAPALAPAYWSESRGGARMEAA